MVGSTLSHYLITAELGRGGMGIVYRATDTKLNRDVAIKVLPAAALASDDDRARFFREAQAAAQLTHPNIATVYQIDEAIPLSEDGSEINASDGLRPFIVMEFIDGETLHDHIQKGPMKLTDAVNISSQVAEALKAAHAKEIVHRDIKSANVMLTEDGVAKVLDFGLAKTSQSTMLTRLGSTLGTVAYMSPEQARGQEVDGRTDLYSLGSMLYEMVAGKPPFSGEYEQAVVYSILNESPEPLTSLRTGVPMGLEWIVNKLLSKEADYRYQTAADLLADLKTVDLSGSGMSRRSMPAATGFAAGSQTAAVGAASENASGGMGAGAAGGAATTRASTQRQKFLPVWGWIAFAGAAAVGVAAGWFARPRTTPIVQPPVRFALHLPEEESLGRLGRRTLAIAPDGSEIAYVTGEGVLVRYTSDIDGSIPLPGLTSPRELFFSPDSQWLGYENDKEGLLMKVSAGGGSETPIADLPGGLHGASWGSDGYIYLGFGADGMGRVLASGGTVEMFTPAPEDSTGRVYYGPSVLPDRKSVIYSVRGESDGWDDGEIRLLDLESGADRLLHSGGTDVRYVNTGHLVYYWRNTLYSIPFDPQKGSLGGSPTPVMDEVAFAFNGVTGGAHVGISENGTLVKVRGAVDSPFSGGALTWSSMGEQVKVSPDVRDFVFPKISPDGRRIATQLGFTPPSSRSIVIVDAIRGVQQPFVDHSGMPVWSPDGEKIVYGSGPHLLLQSVSEPGPIDTLLTVAESGADPTDWSRDGRYIVYNVELPGARNTSIYYLDTKNGQTTDFLENDLDIDYARFSPDGQWVTYELGPALNSQIMIRRFPGGESPLQITSRGQKPVWRPDGKAVLYSDGSGRIIEVEIDLESLTIGPVAQRTIMTTVGFGAFDVNPVDGRVLIIASGANRDPEKAAPSGPILDVVVNWASTLPKAQQ